MYSLSCVKERLITTRLLPFSWWLYLKISFILLVSLVERPKMSQLEVLLNKNSTQMLRFNISAGNCWIYYSFYWLTKEIKNASAKLCQSKEIISVYPPVCFWSAALYPSILFLNGPFSFRQFPLWIPLHVYQMLLQNTWYLKGKIACPDALMRSEIVISSSRHHLEEQNRARRGRCEWRMG